MLRTIRAFWHDQRGIALILASVMLPAKYQLSLLVIDMSRANNLHNDLQKAADAMAAATDLIFQLFFLRRLLGFDNISMPSMLSTKSTSP